MTQTHPDVPLGKHVEVKGRHYVISVLTWPLSGGQQTTKAYRADSCGTVQYGHPVVEIDGDDPEKMIELLEEA